MVLIDQGDTDMANNKIKALKQRIKELEAEKQPWLEHFQLLGEFILTRKSDFTRENTQGDFLNDDLWDNTAPNAARSMAAALLGALWPQGARTIKITAPRHMKAVSRTVKDYYDFMTQEILAVMDHPRSGLRTTLEEYMLDQGVFGTSGIGVFEQEGAIPVRYEPWDVKTMLIDEGKNGFVDTVVRIRSLPIRRVALEYGFENLSAEAKEKFNSGKGGELLKICHIIEPNYGRDPSSFNIQNAPISSIHFEFNSEKILRKSGFAEMPVFVGRFTKALNEKYGRSAGMNALPAIKLLNTVSEAVAIATEKQLDPPLVVLDDGRLGGGTINTSASAINVLNVSGRLDNQNPIQPLFTVGEFQSVHDLMARLEDKITQAFFIDRLLDFNNETRMTLGEAQLRNKFRGESLGPLFSRQHAEIFEPVVERTVNILWKAGRLGVIPGSEEEAILIAQGMTPVYIPDEIIKAIQTGKDPYDIQFISPAQRIMQAEEAQGIQMAFGFAAEIAGVASDVLDNIDTDAGMKRFAVVNGVPSEMLRSEEDVAAIRQNRAEQNQRMQEIAEQREASEIARNQAQAQATLTSNGSLPKQK